MHDHDDYAYQTDPYEVTARGGYLAGTTTTEASAPEALTIEQLFGWDDADPAEEPADEKEVERGFGPPTAIAALLADARAIAEAPPLKLVPAPADLLAATVYAITMADGWSKSDWCRDITRTYCTGPLLDVPLASFTDGTYIEWYESVRLRDGRVPSESTLSSAQSQLTEALTAIVGAFALPPELADELRAVIGNGPNLHVHHRVREAVANSVLDLLGNDGNATANDGGDENGGA